MTAEHKKNGKQRPVHVVRTETVTAEVYAFRSNTGYPYYGYTISRHWSSLTTGKETQGCVFFENSEAAIIETVKKVTEWLRSNAHAEGPLEEAVVCVKKQTSVKENV